MRGRRVAAWALAGVMLTAASAAADGRYDPALRFRTITTPHFVLHYHQGEEPLVLRLARIVEEEHVALVRRLGHAPRAKTHVVLVDQNDESNGWTTPVPYNLIELAAAPPGGESTLGNTDDWLRLVFRHEYTHVLHLDPARGWASVARHVFGRAFFAFPNLTLPQWQIEGRATFEESREGQGRVPAGDFRAILGEAARAGPLEPLDRVNGGLVAWPAGTGGYVYGAYFHDYLARRFGEQKLEELSAVTSGRIPYLTAGAFRSVYGEPLGSLWRAFEADAQKRSSSSSDMPVTRITFHGYATEGPAFASDGSIVYSKRDAHGFPSLERLPAGGGAAVRLSDRYGGQHVAIHGTRVYFDQLDYVRSTGIVSDLYVLDTESGRVRRLTKGARLSDPAVSPDGSWIAAIETRNGRRAIAIAPLAAVEDDGSPISWRYPLGTDGEMAAPRFSPDGRAVAVERRPLHGRSEIVVSNIDGTSVRVIATSDRGRNVTPAWMPDGASIVFASDRAGGPFQLYRVPLDGASGTEVPAAVRMTDLAGGARAPAISDDGQRIAFVGSTRDGYDVFTMAAEDCLSLEADAARAVPATPEDRATPPALPSSEYQPWSTLWPRAWLPIVETGDNELRIGAAAGGSDALAYHAWSAAASWSAARDPALAPVSPGARPDIAVSYAYQRWRPTLYVDAKDETTPVLLPATASSGATALAIREQSVDAGVLLPFRRVRRTIWLLGAYHAEHDVLSSKGDREAFDRGAVRVGAAFSNVRRYGYSISPEWGASAGISAEVSRPGLGSDGRAAFVRGDLRSYLPIGVRHAVLALRATAARTGGDAANRRVLRLGGSDGDTSVVSFSEDASALLRGFPSNAFLGTRVALANAEYRVPLAWIERGHGTWPLFLRSLQATAFVDAGNAWGGDMPSNGVKWAWGAEAGGSLVAGFVLPLDLFAGVAWGHDPSETYRDAPRAYVRVGYGF